jgi:riboflavin synthase
MTSTLLVLSILTHPGLLCSKPVIQVTIHYPSSAALLDICFYRIDMGQMKMPHLIETKHSIYLLRNFDRSAMIHTLPSPARLLDFLSCSSVLTLTIWMGDDDM